MRRALCVGVLAAAALGVGGCNEYRYYDVEVSFNIASGQFSTNEIGTIQACRVTVSGADSRTFHITEAYNKGNITFCPPTINNNPRNVMGIFEYSSHAESGQLTFTMDVWDAISQIPDCHVGSGSTTVQVSDMITTEGIKLVVDKVGTGCM